MPFLARLPGRIPAGGVNRTSVVSSLDLFPTCCRMAGIATPKVAFDGEDISAALLGRAYKRRTDLFWDYGRDASYLRPGLPRDASPNLAVRSGKWKLLQNADGSQVELYDLEASPVEDQNLAAAQPELTRRLSARLLAWRNSLP